MKTRLSRFSKYAKITTVSTVLLTVVFFLTPIRSFNNYVQVSKDKYSPYKNVIFKSLKDNSIEEVEDLKVFSSLESGNIAEAFDVQAENALEDGIAKYWYPHFLATVVLVIDKDQTNKEVLGWNDLYDSGIEVGFLDSGINLEMQVAAMAYGLEGDDFSLNKAVNLLSSIHNKGLLKMKSSTSPIIICFDYQAIALSESNKNLDIIIPSEGSLTFKKGLLSNEKLIFDKDIHNLLIENKLILLDGRRLESLYPSKKDYNRTSEVININHFNKISQKTERLIERKVLKHKLFTSIDNHEHLMFAVFYLIIVTVWTGSVYHRSTQKGIKYSALILGVTLNNWTLVRLVKYQVIALPTLSRYLWYSFYIFQLTIPLVMLWMSWAIDKPKHIIFPPKWWRIIAYITILMVIFVFTNDLHGQVFQLDLNKYDWDVNYTYGIGYFIVLIFGMGNIFLAFLIQVAKSIQNPRKRGFIVPLAIFFLFGLYTYKYITRNPFIYETDITIITGLFAMVMFEACIRFGLIPVNSKYIDLFKQSPIKLQIFDDKREMIFASRPSNLPEKKVINQVLKPNSTPLLYEDTLILGNKIPGGYAVWYEDIKKINELFTEIIESRKRLKEANLLLKKESKLQKNLNEQLAKKQLNKEFEKEIAQTINTLTKMVDNLDANVEDRKALTRITLLLTYIKRRSNLFFVEKQKDHVNVSKLINYIEELSTISTYTSTQVTTLNEVAKEIPSRYVTLFYEFFYQILNDSIVKESPYLINYFETDSENFIMRLLPSKNLGIIKFENKLYQSVKAASGFIEIKDIEDSIGISLSFKKGGADYDGSV